MQEGAIDLEDLWALQEGAGKDARGRELEILVPAADPELGPYTAHRFLPIGDTPPKGWRSLTAEEVREAMEGAEEDTEA